MSTCMLVVYDIWYHRFSKEVLYNVTSLPTPDILLTGAYAYSEARVEPFKHV